ncbi:MAG: D-2-hydroxyacid dehydrogenase [Flavitalea sp.]
MSSPSLKDINIVIADGHTLNPGDLSWDEIYDLGNIQYYDRTPVALMAERCKDAVIIVTNKAPVNAETINGAKQLRLIAVTATGYNIVDTEAAKKNGVIVCNVPVYGTDSVAQHTFSLLLELSNRVGLHAESVARGEWSKAADWCYTLSPITEISGKTLGIVGFGRIGQRVARIAQAFGMQVLYHNRSAKEGLGKQVSMEELFSKSDFVSLHCPVTRDNTGFVNAALLSLMKPTAFLINTSRGQLINEKELAEVLKNRGITGAALDVLSIEPPPADHPLIGIPGCLITPHVAWVSFEARKRLMKATKENIADFLNGSPQNLVN